MGAGNVISGPLADSTSADVTNVVIFISDSLRYDAVPTSVTELGVHGRAIAGSTFTASGYPSILTGQYPSDHRVWTFEDSLATTPPLLAEPDRAGIDATTVWENVDRSARKPPLRICGETEETTLAELESPYVHVVHDVGGHMIYGTDDEEEEDWADHAEFFDAFAGAPEKIETRYHQSVAASVDRFLSIVETLKARGEFDETLVIFTSDHGELLGEYGGLYTHGVPLVPELVEVPFVLAGAGLPADVRFDGLLSTTDVAPTALSAIGGKPPETAGYDLWTRAVPSDRVARAEVWKETSYPYIKYRASSVWTRSGGYVRRLDAIPSRLLHLAAIQLYYASYANMVRRPSRRLGSLARAHLQRTTTYGEPPAPSVVDRHLVTDFSRREGGPDRPAPDTAQLRELGYLE